MAGPERLVFCDVDETLVRCKSLVDFLGFYFEGRYGPEGTRRADGVIRDLSARAALGIPREQLNREYYRTWRGQPLGEVEAWGRHWFAERSTAADFYASGTADALRRHRRDGAVIVLVSGSLPALLDPIAQAVGAGHVLCCRQQRCGRVLTGELLGPPVIGEEKARLVRHLLARYPRVDPADCFGYGDDPSDLPMLGEVGHPVMVTATAGAGRP